MTVKLEKGDAAQCFFSLPEQKERVGSGNHKPGQLLIVTYQRTDSIFSSRNQEIFFSDPFQWSLFKAMKYYPTIHTLMWQRKQRVAIISLFIPSQGEEVVVMEIYWPLKLSMVKVIKVRGRGNIQYYWNNWNIMEYRKMKKQTVRKN